MRLIGIVMLAGGLLALAYGGFGYARTTHDATLGPLHVSVSERSRVNVPMWVGVVLTALGGGMLISWKRQPRANDW